MQVIEKAEAGDRGKSRRWEVGAGDRGRSSKLRSRSFAPPVQTGSGLPGRLPPLPLPGEVREKEDKEKQKMKQ